MRQMDDRKLIELLGGQTALARKLNKKLRAGDKLFSPQRVNGWKVANKIPAYVKLAYKRVLNTPAG